MLFGIIQSEYDSPTEYADTGVVVQQCLGICGNILRDAEPCQRFFFEMGSNWPLRLAYFFDPALLENTAAYYDGSSEGKEGKTEPWYLKPGCVECAKLAFRALSNGLAPAHEKHQKLLGVSLQGLIPAAAYCIARNGPAPMVFASLELLYNMVVGNEAVAKCFVDAVMKVTRPIANKTIPEGIPIGSLFFGYASSIDDQLTNITVPHLLSERYIFKSFIWRDTNEAQMGGNSPEEISMECLRILEAQLAADKHGCILLIQYIIAPPLPLPMEDSMDESYDQDSAASNAPPLAALIYSVVIEGCCQILYDASLVPLDSHHEGLLQVMKASNLLSLILINGGEVAQELCTAILLNHIYNNANTHWRMQKVRQSAAPLPDADQTIIKSLLVTVHQLARLGPAGHQGLCSLLCLLSTSISGCALAVNQVLNDSNNFFVMDLASESSENAGVPAAVQICACLFLGSCYSALSHGIPGKQNNGEAYTQTSFLKMIDNRISLNRMSELLRIPNSDPSQASSQGIYPNLGDIQRQLFYCDTFKRFYNTQVDAILNGVLHFYTDNSVSTIENIDDTTATTTSNSMESIPVNDQTNQESNDGEGEHHQSYTGTLPETHASLNTHQISQEITVVTDNNDDYILGNEEQSRRIQELEVSVLERDNALYRWQEAHEATLKTLSELETANTNHSQTIDNLQQYISELETLKSESAATIEELKCKGTDFALLQEKCDAQSAEVDQLKKLNAQLREDHDESVTVVDTLRGDLGAEKELNKRLEMEMKALQDTLQEAEQSLKNTEAGKPQKSLFGSPQRDGAGLFDKSPPRDDAIQAPAGGLFDIPFTDADDGNAIQLQKEIEECKQEMENKDAKIESLEKDLASHITMAAEAKRALEDNEEARRTREENTTLKTQLRNVSAERDVLLQKVHVAENKVENPFDSSAPVAADSPFAPRTKKMDESNEIKEANTTIQNLQADLKVKDDEIETLTKNVDIMEKNLKELYSLKEEQETILIQERENFAEWNQTWNNRDQELRELYEKVEAEKQEYVSELQAMRASSLSKEKDDHPRNTMVDFASPVKQTSSFFEKEADGEAIDSLSPIPTSSVQTPLTGTSALVSSTAMRASAALNNTPKMQREVVKLSLGLDKEVKFLCNQFSLLLQQSCLFLLLTPTLSLLL